MQCGVAKHRGNTLFIWEEGGGGAGVMAILTVYITGPSSSGCPVKRVLNKEEKHLYKMKKKIQLRAAIDM